ncbi:biotin--[acetyl-CoA-carboxylase] ligase [Mesotoga sp. HF07.pep.5.2.highcov]|jgi:BirA family biotin operon repressor/biotin-[acetyl-CoA-carboxylase] ligase|uniref:biotin--[acetyl-CoA-carboxylase] ligase n=1 Tax=Mesotoga sp. HF07.pep.5.2.highcov TaxID=1462923 RepID=UPI000EF1436D|nr:biotin--[acetyl-CoA-carboxylase] ligase [Mesotoga sp. HF07.pep.5.2.highcov]
MLLKGQRRFDVFRQIHSDFEDEIPTMMVGENIVSFSEIDSTNVYARNNLDKLPSGTVVWALSQTSGYGRHNSFWYSNKGGLWFSIVFKPSLIREPNEYTKVVSVAVAETMIKMGINSVGIKWPNDVLIGKRKVAGILTEAIFSGISVNAIVVGVGINVNNELPEEIRQIAISLGMVINKHISLEMLLDKVLKRVEFLRKNYLIRGKNRYLTRRWKKYLAFAEKDEITVSLPNGEKITGIINSITPSSLCLEREDGVILEINSGEILL